MSKAFLFLSSIAALSLAITFCGCSGDSDSPEPAAPPETPPPAEEQASMEHMDAAPDDSQKEEMLADLSPEDRAAVEKQGICPVGGGSLWAMGKPYKTTVTAGDGTERVVFLCCDGCKEAIQSEPDKYLAKLE
jgi:hypothetical protein